MNSYEGADVLEELSVENVIRKFRNNLLCFRVDLSKVRNKDLVLPISFGIHNAANTDLADFIKTVAEKNKNVNVCYIFTIFGDDNEAGYFNASTYPHDSPIVFIEEFIHAQAAKNIVLPDMNEIDSLLG